MFLGWIVLLAALITMSWNEKENVCANNIFMYAEDHAIVASCDDAKKYEGLFVFYSCPLDDEKTTMTPLTSFNLPGLKEHITFDSPAGSQNVEMYQCIETADKVEGGEAATNLAHQGEAAEAESDESSGSYLTNPLALAEQEETLDRTSQNSTELAEEASGHVEMTIEASGNLEMASIVRHAHTHKRKPQSHISQDQESSTFGSTRETVTDTALGQETRYKYHMGWSNVWYDSFQFKATPEEIQKAGCSDFVYNRKVNHNPNPPFRGDGKRVELGRLSTWSAGVKAGGFTFTDEDLIKTIKADEDIPMTPFKSGFSLNAATDNIVTTIAPNTVTVHDDSPMFLSTCKTDRLGCIRISYQKASITHMSVIGFAGAAGVMEPWNVEGQEAKYPMQKSYTCDTTPFIKMVPRSMLKSEMIAYLRGDHTVQTWALRVAGMIALWFGFYCALDPFASSSDRMASYLAYIPWCGPCFGKAMDGVVEMFVCLISCALGMSCGMVAAGLVWAGLRPVIGAPLCAGGVVMFCIGYAALNRAWRDPRKCVYDHAVKQQPLMPGGWQGQGHPGAWQGETHPQMGGWEGEAHPQMGGWQGEAPLSQQGPAHPQMGGWQGEAAPSQQGKGAAW